MRRYDRVYADIHLDRAEENMRAMQGRLRQGVKMIGVVKADGYGHGAVPIARTIDRFVSSFAVATVDEALLLRRHGVKKGILTLGPAAPGRYREMAEQEIRPALFSFEDARAFSGTAGLLHRKAKIHVAVDTGMGRIGLTPDEAGADEAARMAALPWIEIEGVFTHFSRADETDKRNAKEQLERFLRFLSFLEARGISVPVRHCANSAGIIDLGEAQMDAVRAGISIYGLYPSDEVNRGAVALRPVMELKSFVTFIKQVEPGTEISYGGTFTAEKTMRVATVGVGYGDGYPRNLSGRGAVLIRGRRAGILGRVCMDQMMVDVTDIPGAAAWDTVTLIGRDGDEEITVEELARDGGGFHYEIPCVLGKRVPRVYLYRGEQVGTKDYFDDCCGDFAGLPDFSRY